MLRRFRNLKILLIGGTRFIGRNLANRLVLDGHELTILSKKDGNIQNAIYIKMLKKDGLKYLIGEKKRFDIVIDFLSYKVEDLDNLIELQFGHYFLISTVWVEKLCKGTSLDQAIYKINFNRKLSGVTYDYIKGKIEVENSLLNGKLSNMISILRLPIILGEGEHTGRYDFYKIRAQDSFPYVFINDINNKVQITYPEDISKAISESLKRMIFFLIQFGKLYQIVQLV